MASSSEKLDVKDFLLGKREAEDVLDIKPILKKHKEESEEEMETTKGFADGLQHIKSSVDLLETNSDDQANLIPLKETVERVDESPYLFMDFVESFAAVSKKTLFLNNISTDIGIKDIIIFFKDVGKVVRVQIPLTCEGSRMPCGFVEFASADEANKALEQKNGEYLFGSNITMRAVAEISPYPPRPKYCLDHKVCHEDYLQLPTKEEETPPDFSEAGAVIIKTKALFVSNLSPQASILHITDFFKDVSKVVSIRLIVNHESKHVGYGFVEFSSAYEANKAMEMKNGNYLFDHKIFLHVAKTDPYSPQPKYNLADQLWYEDYLRGEIPLIEEEETEEETPPYFVDWAVALSLKTLCIFRISVKTKISDIINFFKDVGQVVHVRIVLNHSGRQHNYGFVEFASVNEANKALEKDGECLLDRKIYLREATYAPRSKYCMDHKFWYEDYLRGEGLLIEDEAVEGLDDITELVKEVDSRKKTLFISGLYDKIKIQDIISFFGDVVGQVFSVRLSVDAEGKRLGCGFIEFASTWEAKKALEVKHEKKMRFQYIYLRMAEIAPYPLQPKYILAEKLWSEDYVRQETLREKQKKQMSEFCGKKITFSDEDLIEEDEAL